MARLCSSYPPAAPGLFNPALPPRTRYARPQLDTLTPFVAGEKLTGKVLTAEKRWACCQIVCPATILV